MERKDFLKLVGTSIAMITIGSCLDGCKKKNTSPSAPSVDFTLDLTNPAYSALNTNGGYLYYNGVIVARTMAGAFIAVSQACTHNGVTVTYEAANNDFFCSAHGSKFSANGGVIAGPASSSLKQYAATLNGSSLRVKG